MINEKGTCRLTCPDGYESYGTDICYKKTNITWPGYSNNTHLKHNIKISKLSTDGMVLDCSAGELPDRNNPDICYSKCPTKYRGINTECIEECPDGYLERDTYTCVKRTLSDRQEITPKIQPSAGIS